MAFEFRLPEIGEGVKEGEIVRWLVREGDTVLEDQPILEIMTDKATMEMASPRAGVIEAIAAKEGDTVPIGGLLVRIAESSIPRPVGAPEAPSKSVAAATPASVGFSKAASAQASSIVPASPATRRLAREKGIDISSVSPTGPSGRVTREDILRTSAKADSDTHTASPARSAASNAAASEERIPLRGVRRKIAEHMVKSKHVAPHFTQVDEVDFTSLVEWRAHAKAKAEAMGVKLTFLPAVIRALIVALREFPYLNASMDDQSAEIVLKRYYNIGIAAATPAGLVVPVIRNADKMSILELSMEIQRLADKARKGTLSLEEMQEGTFTITSTGASGGLFAAPIINHPEVAILGIHRFRPTPVVRQGQVVIRQMGYFSLSLDHRIIDGAVGADFLRRLIPLVENPALLLLEQ